MSPRTLLLPLLFCCCIVAASAETQKEERPVDPGQLTTLIRQANKIVVTMNTSSAGEQVLYHSTARKDLDEFAEAVAVTVPQRHLRCFCIGSPLIHLYRDEQKLVSISDQHRYRIRCSLWSSDAPLVDSAKWVRWFDARNIPGPGARSEQMAAQAKKSELAHERWQAALPDSVRPFWRRATPSRTSPDVESLRTAFAAAFPNARERALALFEWFGSGEGPWSGFPLYELAAEELLLEIPTADLIAAAQDERLSEVQLEGAARLFAGGGFAQRHANEPNPIPAALKSKLLKHSHRSGDSDKISRANHAFQE